jgi:hypothetical protein
VGSKGFHIPQTFFSEGDISSGKKNIVHDRIAGRKKITRARYHLTEKFNLKED